MKALFQKYGHFLFALYVFIYLPWFFYLENAITDYHIIHCKLDDIIPFNEYFIIPYMMWFFYIVIGFLFLFFTETKGNFIRFGICLTGGMTIAMIICSIYPNGLNLRPEVIAGDNVFQKIVLGLYKTDTSTNVFPSVHVLNSLVVHVALRRNDVIKKYPLLRILSGILCIAIILSTVFLKQHSVLDVIGAIILYTALYLVIYIPDWKCFKNPQKILH